jgi:hypothetical protein
MENEEKTKKTSNFMIHLLIMILLSTSMPILIVFLILSVKGGVENTWMRAYKFLNELGDEIDKL